MLIKRDYKVERQVDIKHKVLPSYCICKCIRNTCAAHEG